MPAQTRKGEVMEQQSEIFKLATTVKKPKKDDAYELICKMVNGQELNDYQLAQLLAFFVTAVTITKIKNSFDWCAQAVNKDALKNPAMNYVYVKNGKAYATDGYRIHEIDTALTNGFYTTKGQHIECDQAYPNTSVIMDREFTLPVNNCNQEEIHEIKGKPTKVALLKDTTGKIIYVESRFFKQATATMQQFKMSTIENAEFAPIKITDHAGKVAILMPLNLNG